MRKLRIGKTRSAEHAFNAQVTDRTLGLFLLRGCFFISCFQDDIWDANRI